MIQLRSYLLQNLLYALLWRTLQYSGFHLVRDKRVKLSPQTVPQKTFGNIVFKPATAGGKSTTRVVVLSKPCENFLHNTWSCHQVKESSVSYQLHRCFSFIVALASPLQISFLYRTATFYVTFLFLSLSHILLIPGW